MLAASVPPALQLATNVRPTRPLTPGEDEVERRRKEQDDYLDEALKETFPASDSIAPGRPHLDSTTEGGSGEPSSERGTR